jgi:hypothetical protein
MKTSISFVVSSELVVSRMILSIPYVGHAASISHSFIGFLRLVLAPGIVVNCGEVVSIVRKEKMSQGLEWVFNQYFIKKKK